MKDVATDAYQKIVENNSKIKDNKDKIKKVTEIFNEAAKA